MTPRSESDRVVMADEPRAQTLGPRILRRIPAPRLLAASLVVAALCLSLVALTETPTRRVLYDQRSAFSRVLVVEEDGLRCLRFGRPDAPNQSCADRSKPEHVVFEYVRHTSLGLAFVPRPRRAVLVGVGGGSILQMLQRQIPNLHFDAVDIDPMVVDAAQRFFGVREGARLRLVTADGRKFIESSGEPWDLIFLDAFGEDNVPFALTTVEFLRAVAARLAPRGAVVANIWRDNEPLFRAMLQTYGRVFPTVQISPTPTHLNAIVIAMKESPPPGRDELLAQAREVAERTRFPFDYVATSESLRSLSSYDLRDAPVLSDQHPELHRCLSGADKADRSSCGRP